MADAAPQANERKRRRWLTGIVIAIAIVLVLVLLLPMFVSWGLGRGVIIGTIRDYVDGDVHIEQLSVSWFGDQEFKGLSIDPEDDRTHVVLDGVLDRSLIGLIFGGPDYGTLTLSGQVQGVRRADGTSTLAEIIKTPEEPSTEPLELKLAINLTDVDILLDDVATGETLAVNDLKGVIDLDLPVAVRFDLDAATAASNVTGAVAIEGGVTDLFDENGALSRDAVVDLAANLSTVPVALLDAILGLENRLASLTGPMLDAAELRLSGTAEEAEGQIRVQATRLRAQGAARIEDAALRIDGDQPLTVRIAASDDLLAAWLPADEKSGRLRLVERNGDGEPIAEVRVDRLVLPLPVDGGLDLEGANATIALAGRNFTFIVPPGLAGDQGERVVEVTEMSGSVSSDDLTEAIDIALDAKATIDESQESRLEADLTMMRLLAPDGAVIFDPANVQGRVAAQAMPTSLLQPFLADTPVVLSRDIGETIELAASFSSGQARAIEVTASASNLQARVVGDVTEAGAIDGRLLSIESDLSPDLLAALAPRAGLRVPRHASVNLTRFTVPPVTREQPFDLRNIGVTGTVSLDGEEILVEATADADEATATRRPYHLASVAFNVQSSALGEEIELRGTAVAERSTIEVDEVVTQLFGPEGELQPLDAIATGTIVVRDLTPGTLEPFVTEQVADIVRQLIDQGALATIETEPQDGNLVAQVTLESSNLRANLSAKRTAEAIEVQGGTIRAAVSEDLARALQPQSEEPVLLSADEIVIDLAPMTLASRTAEGFEFQAGALEASVASERLVIRNAPGVAEGQAVALRDLDAALAARLSQRTYSAKGNTVLLNPDGDASVAGVEFDVQVEPAPGGDRSSPLASITLSDVAVAQIDRLRGDPEDTLAKLLGETGGLSLQAEPTDDGWRGSFDVRFPYVTGVFAASMGEEAIEVSTPSQPQIVLRKSAVEAMLNRAPADNEDIAAPPPARIEATSDVPVLLSIRELRLPAAVVSGGPLASDADSFTAIDIELAAAEPVSLRRVTTGEAAGEPLAATFRNLTLTAKSDSLASGVNFTAGSNLRTGGSDGRSRSRLEAKGQVRNLLDEQSAFAPGNAAIDLDATLAAFPTWVADALGGTNSLLQDALGATVDATVSSRAFSFDSGRMSLEVNSANGSTLSAELAGRNGGIRTQRDKAAQGALVLSDALKRQLLYNIHGIFADVETANEKIRFNLSNAFLPAGGDLSKLNADLSVEVGEVQLRTGSQFLRLLQYINTSNRESIGAKIDPLEVSIRNGVLTYDDFVVHLVPEDGAYKHRLVFGGKVNLPEKRVVSILGAYPVSDLKNSIRELQVVPDGVTIGLRFFGDLFAAGGAPQDLKFELAGDIDVQEFGGGLLEQLIDGERIRELEGLPQLRDLFRLFEREGSGGGG